MTVIIRKKETIGDKEVILKTYQPSGRLSKQDRIRADLLDKVLSERIPNIASEVADIAPRETDSVHRWYLLGRNLRKIVKDQNLVDPADIDNMLIWEAIYYFLPESMRPSSFNNKPYSEKQHKRQDFLSLCYEISGFKWSEVKWIKRWSDWHQISHRPGLLRDKRILIALGDFIDNLESYPSHKEIIEIVKDLGNAFPTRKLRDSSLFNDKVIIQTVKNAVNQNLFK